MPRSKKANKLVPFQSHGVVFLESRGDEHLADCIFCGKEKHFSTNSTTAQWGCWKCGASGNLQGFLSAIIGLHEERTTNKDYARLAKLRKNVAKPKAYKLSGMAFNHDTGQWLMPIKSTSGEVQQIRTWKGPPEKQQKTAKSPDLKNTATLQAALWGEDRLMRFPKARVWICEGEWDGIALSWLFYITNKKDEIVIAVPGAAIFKAEWFTLLGDRKVIMSYDADTSGDENMRKYGERLKTCVTSLEFVRWALHLEDGYDISDLILDADSPDTAVNELLALVSSVIRTEAESTATKKKKTRQGKIDFAKVEKVYGENLVMPPETVHTLRVILGTVMTTQILGDPLWVFIVSPPAGGKTTLLNPLRSIVEKVVFRSNLQRTTLVSGWQDSQDPSLIPKLDGMCLVLKDITELLQEAEHVQREVFGVLQGIYDGYLDRSYGNKVVRKYESHFNAVAGVTTAVHGHQKASMGERWLKMQLTTREKRKKHESRMIQSALRSLGKEKEQCSILSEVTAHFLDRELDRDWLKKRTPEWVYNAVESLARLVAKLRINVERIGGRDDLIKFLPEEELGTRLGKQFLKLLWGLIETNPNREVGTTEWAIVEQVAFDTAIGWNLDVVQAMMNSDGVMTRAEIREATSLPRGNIERAIADMEALRFVRKETDPADKRNTYFRLTQDIQGLWRGARIQNDHIEVSKLVRQSRRGIKLKPRKS